MILAIDTSGSETSVAVSFDGQTEQQVLTGSSHSDNLNILVKTIFENISAPINGIKTILIGAGPGSFTGLRIGFAFGKGLAMATSAKVGLYSSLQAAGYAAAINNEHILVIDDARREEYFAGLFQRGPSGLKLIGKERIVPFKEIQQIREAYSNCALVSSNIDLAQSFADLVTAKSLAGGILDMYQQGVPMEQASKEGIEGVASLSPNYLRAVAALSIKERQEQAQKA